MRAEVRGVTVRDEVAVIEPATSCPIVDEAHSEFGAIRAEEVAE
jgi:hypothetical protein